MPGEHEVGEHVSADLVERAIVGRRGILSDILSGLHGRLLRGVRGLLRGLRVRGSRLMNRAPELRDPVVHSVDEGGWTVHPEVGHSVRGVANPDPAMGAGVRVAL